MNASSIIKIFIKAAIKSIVRINQNNIVEYSDKVSDANLKLDIVCMAKKLYGN